ncbi:MAG: membrane dipeptidase [Armatimonadetes bacterium]|nr:membrane dipeptidase [Armatimonadota bacterium]
MDTRWLETARRLHAQHPAVDTLAPNWDSEMYLSPHMVEMARALKAQGLSRGNIQARLAAYLVDNIATDAELRRGYLDWWKRSGVTAASTSLVFSGPPSRSWEYVLGAIGRSDRLLDGLRGHFIKGLRPEDVEAAHASGQHAIIFNLQNADPVGDDFARVDTLYGLGVRIVQLTYNLRNLYGDGCVERRDGGLSRFGVKLVEKLNERRIVVDTSHCADQTLLDALEVSARPIAVTHSCSRKLGNHPRGKPDHILRAVAERGGYIGILIAPAMLTPTGRGATLDTVVDHMMYVLDIAGTEAVGIGTDWGKPYYLIMEWTYDSIVESIRPGDFDWVGWLPEHRFSPNEACGGMETWDLWPNLTAKMLERGLAEEAVARIVGRNFLRFWRDVVGSASSAGKA